MNIAQHSYFNLAGHDAGDVLQHVATIKGDHYTPVDDTSVPTGEIVPVRGTPFDFLEPHPIGERLEQLPDGYDINYVLFGMGAQARFIVTPKSHGKAVSV